jgi:hypothetical protein
MNKIRLAVVTALVAAGWVSGAVAQGFGPPQRDDFGEQLGKLFGKNLAFTAVAQMTVANAAGKSLHTMEMDYAMRDGNVRSVMDIGRMKTSDMPAEAVAHMKSLGMDRTIAIGRPAERVTFIVYPGLKAYCVMTAPTGAPLADKPPKIERETLGQETVDGHPCTKQRVIITDDDGKKQEVLVWSAIDLKDFPIQTQMTTGKQTMTMLFQKIKLEAPPAELFHEPKNFQKYGTLQELMMGAMQGMMSQGHPPLPPPEEP